jgi:hypothetical protein
VSGARVPRPACFGSLQEFSAQHLDHQAQLRLGHSLHGHVQPRHRRARPSPTTVEQGKRGAHAVLLVAEGADERSDGFGSMTAGQDRRVGPGLKKTGDAHCIQS